VGARLHTWGMDLRTRIEAVMAAQPDFTVRNISLKAGLSDSWLHKLLKGDVRSPTLENVEKLAEALDVDPRWLAFGEGDPERFADIGRIVERFSEEQAEMARQMLQVIARTGTTG
jgi:transcriptional regulator with XRE-family HTH domain